MKKLQQTREVIIHALQYIHGKTLDFGAGTAKYRIIIKPKTTEYTTFDVAPGENIDIIGDVLATPFSSGTFDTVISTQVIEHVAKPWVMITEIHRILKNGGHCILTAPFLIPYHADPHDYFRFTPEGLKSLFQHAGFETIECQSYGSIYSVLSEMIHFIFFNPYAKKPTNWTNRIVRYLNKAAKFFDTLTDNKIAFPNSYIIAIKR